MDKDLHDIEDLFRAGLDDNEERPSSNVWDAIDIRLDKDTVIIIKKKYNTLKKISLLLLLLLIGLSLYELSNRHTDDSLAKINSTSVDKEPTPNNDIQKQNNKNAFTSKEQVNPKDLTNNTAVNTIPGNSTIITQSPGSNFIISKQNQTTVASTLSQYVYFALGILLYLVLAN